MNRIKVTNPRILRSVSSYAGGSDVFADPEVMDDDPRAFDDIDEINTRTAANVVDRLSKLEPVAWGDKVLSLEDVKISEAPDATYKAQKMARLERASISRPVWGTYVLKDAEGTELDRSKKMLMKLPHLTNEGVYYLNGIQYSIGNQQRMRSGIYTHKKQNGEIETHFNCEPGGKQFRVVFDAEHGRFDVKVGQATLPFLPVYRALGGTDESFKAKFGDDLFDTHKQADKPGGLKRLVASLNPKYVPVEGEDPSTSAIKDAMSKMKYDPDSTARTVLGRPVDKLDSSVLEDVISNQIKLNKNEILPDSRDDLQFQRVVAPKMYSPSKSLNAASR